MKPLFLLFLGACAATHASTKAAGPQLVVVAELEGERILQSDVDKSASAELSKIDKDAEKQRYETRKQALDSILFRKLVERKAKAQGIDSETFIEREIEAKLAKVSEDEAQKFYEKNKERMGGQEFEALKERIMEFMNTQRRSDAVVALFQRLRSESKVKVSLLAPPPERKQVEATGPSLGAANAKVVIVTFSDFQCPFCSRARDVADKVMTAYPGQVRLVFRQFPLPFHQNAFKAAEASLCANDQGKFWALHDYMFKHQDELAVDALKQDARTLGLDGDQFDKCIDESKHASEVTANIAAAKLLGVEGTPAFFINGIELHGAQPFERFVEIIDAELARDGS